MKHLLTIAGSDSSGGAGIQADLKTFAAHGTFGMSVITAVTAQNTTGVTRIQNIDAEVVAAQIDAVFSDIHVDAVARYLYHIEEGGTAMRYGVAIGRGDLYEPGTYTIKRKVEWPHWTPTRNMIKREPEIYAQFEGGVEPGPQNALGSRALYLYLGDRDTYLRIHGTPFPTSIGSRASSGCVRMVMAHINGLYPRVQIGSTAYLYSPEGSVTAIS